MLYQLKLYLSMTVKNLCCCHVLLTGVTFLFTFVGQNSNLKFWGHVHLLFITKGLFHYLSTYYTIINYYNKLQQINSEYVC